MIVTIMKQEFEFFMYLAEAFIQSNVQFIKASYRTILFK